MTTAYFTHPRCTEHDLPSHPEHAGRIRAVWKRLNDDGLSARMTRLEPEPVTDDHILAVHTQPYLELLKQLPTLDRIVRLDSDTYATPTSLDVARLSAGAAVRAVDVVLHGEAENALVVSRPPGHHAMPGSAMGFCLLGNIAVAARHAQRAYGVDRVLIVDYDVHHGNGTEAVFYADPSVLFVSTHQATSAYGSPFYPGTGRLNDIGEGRGEGCTINIPLPPGHSDASYIALFDQVVLPAARRFRPHLVLVSAGFDAHWIDPLAGMRLSLQGYAYMTRALMDFAQTACQGRIIFVMEGGYNLESLSHGVANIARILLGDPAIVDPLGPPDDGMPEPDVQPLITRLRALHQLA
jgi:acetoin utilization deacetylase AcuC-like enzyme